MIFDIHNTIEIGSDSIKFKVLIVDDSVFMRNLISKYIESDPSFQVVGIARNGIEAIDKVKLLQPDVITMDVEMPEMNGLDALKVIMKQRPTPTIMLSSLTQFGALETIAALQAGAVDFISKPSGSVSFDLFKIQEELIQKLKAAVQVPRNTLRQLSRQDTYQCQNQKQTSNNTKIEHIVSIGTSTGGPQALSTILSRISVSFQHPIVIVQHMPPGFTTSLAQRLNSISSLTVVEAQNDEIVKNGVVYIAPGGYHINIVERLGRYKIILHQQMVSSRHRPSVDELFSSVTKLHKLKRHYILLTGMGDDGATEMLNAKRLGATSTIAEAKESCVVYGMPRVAVEKGAVDHVVPLELIAQKLQEVTQ